MTLLSYFFYFILFLFSILFAFILPGVVVLGRRRHELSLFSYGVIATVLGMVLWGWQGFVFGYLNVRFLSYAYLAFFLCIFLYRYGKKIWKQKKVFGSIHIDAIVVALVVIGVLVQSLPMAGNGIRLTQGLYFCCGDPNDNFFHLALTRAIVQHVPPFEPGMDGVLVKNYHYWSNLVIGDLIRVFHLSLISTQFQFSMVFISIFLGLTSIAFASVWKLSLAARRWLIFFVYFGADAIWVLLLTLGRLGDLRHLSSLEDGAKFLVNPPRAYSFIMALTALTLFGLWRRQKSVAWCGVVSMILFASTVGFKVYTAFFFIPGFVLLGIYWLIRGWWKDVAVLSLFFVFSAVIYLPTNAGAGGLIWAPLSIVHDFIVQERIGLVRLEFARRIFYEHSNVPRILVHETYLVLLFMFSIFGTKMLGFVPNKKILSFLGKEVAVLLGSGIIVSTFLGLFFLQRSGGANTFNFLVSAWLFLTVYASISIACWQQSLPRIWSIALGLFIVLATIPRIALSTYTNAKNYFSFDYFMVPNEEIEVYEYMENHVPPDALMVTDPRLGIDLLTPYIPALIPQRSYFSGKGILDSHGQHSEERKKTRDILYGTRDPLVVASILKETGIAFVHLYRDLQLTATESAQFISYVYGTPEAAMYQVDTEKLYGFLESRKH